MSRKSFRKSKGRKTRSMRKRTMGGGVSVQELVQKAEREYNLGNNEAVKKLLAPLKNEGMFSGITRCPSNQKQCEDRKAKSYAEAYVMTNTEIFKKKMYTHAENAVIHTNPNYYLNLANEKFKKTTTQTPPEPETSSPEPAPEPAPAPAATSTSAKKLLELEIIIQELQVKFNGNLLPADKFSSEYLKQFINRCQEKYGENFTPNTEYSKRPVSRSAFTQASRHHRS